MSEDVAMEDEVADVGSTEVREYLDLRVRNDWFAVVVGAGRWVDAALLWRRTTAERHLDHIQELAVDGWRLLTAVDLEVVLGQNHEMDLVLVQFVVLAGVVLDDPFLHGSLGGDDRRRVVIVECGVNRIRLSSAPAA